MSQSALYTAYDDNYKAWYLFLTELFIGMFPFFLLFLMMPVNVLRDSSPLRLEYIPLVSAYLAITYLMH